MAQVDDIAGRHELHTSELLDALRTYMDKLGGRARAARVSLPRRTHSACANAADFCSDNLYSVASLHEAIGKRREETLQRMTHFPKHQTQIRRP